MRTPKISLTAAVGLIEAIAAKGADPDAVLRTVGTTRTVLTDPNGFIPSADFAHLLEEAARATGDEYFGLHFGEHFQPRNIGPLIYVILNSPTMAVAFDNVVRYLKVHNEAGQVTFGYDERSAYLRQVPPGTSVERMRQASEYSMAIALNTIRLMAGSRWAPQEVEFAHQAPSRSDEHLRVFAAPVSFGYGANRLIIDRAFLDRQVPAADDRLYPILRQYLDRMLKEMPREDDVLTSLRRTVAEAIRAGEPNLAEVASKSAMSGRTLQRRLREYGLDFKKLVDDTRRRFSLKYLEDRAHTPAEIAYMLGYSEVSAFNRAFKRWTGSTPSSYRRETAGRSRVG